MTTDQLCSPSMENSSEFLCISLKCVSTDNIGIYHLVIKQIPYHLPPSLVGYYRVESLAGLPHHHSSKPNKSMRKKNLPCQLSGIYCEQLNSASKIQLQSD